MILYNGMFEVALVKLIVGYLYHLENLSGRHYSFIAHCEVPLPFLLLLIVVLKGYVNVHFFT